MTDNIATIDHPTELENYQRLFEFVSKSLNQMSHDVITICQCKHDQERVSALCKYVKTSQKHNENMYQLLITMHNLQFGEECESPKNSPKVEHKPGKH